jgi:serine/threonine protein kinase
MVWKSGQQLQSGKYTIEQELGAGGFGITYRARDNK